jgi:hypothetical protein
MKMREAIKSGLRAAAVVLVTATLGFAQASMSGPVPYGPGAASNALRYGQAPPRGEAVPGTINYVEGQVTLNGQPLGPTARGSVIAQPNEAIDTQDGYAEVLLTPGAFLRIGQNSEVVLQSASLANIQVQVVRGSAMLEAAELVKGATMQVTMNGATTQIEKHGLYEFDANQQLVRVLDGKAKVLEASRVKTIGKGDQVVLTNADLKARGFDKQAAEADPLYVWSKARSAAEAESNVTVANSVALYGGWYGPGWYWNPFWGEYAFLPGAGFLYSPFGFGFYSPRFVVAAPVYRGFYARPGFAAHVYAGHAFAGHAFAGHGFAGRGR